MSREETLKILAVLKVAYPGFYRGMKPGEAESVVSLWEDLFRKEPYDIVSYAVKALLETDEKGYPPNIGAVKARIRLLTQSGQMTEMEAWRLVREAIRGASMDASSRLFHGESSPLPETSAQRNFLKLPEQIQRIIGGPEQLAEWEKLPDDEINTITQSNFMRSYRTRSQQDRELDAIPADVRAAVASIAGKLALEGST